MQIYNAVLNLQNLFRLNINKIYNKMFSMIYHWILDVNLGFYVYKVLLDAIVTLNLLLNAG
jgi:hypothetical protein